MVIHQLIHEFIQTLDRLEKDDDNEQWARRCALMASRLCKPAHRPKQKVADTVDNPLIIC